MTDLRPHHSRRFIPSLLLLLFVTSTLFLSCYPGFTEPDDDDTLADDDDDSSSADDDDSAIVLDDDDAISNDDDSSSADDDDTASEFAEYDDFDENNITWLHTDVSGWDVTSTVTDAHINYTELCVFHTMAGQWPEVLGIFPGEPEAPMEGNIWIIARITGVWYAATFDYLRPGDECKYEDFSPAGEGPGPSTFGAVPLSTWIPRPGEPVYMFMSTVARHKPLGPLHERSDYRRMLWP